MGCSAYIVLAPNFGIRDVGLLEGKKDCNSHVI
jgi:hypothetical protein